ncbi:vancomycin permeability regulator SanA [Nocardia sp. GAS34]|uniref:SanA/YdcF family protein n=1 Tax=unclassified Nocardia TaxID=2637762 RepID=UPI003D1AA970
MAERRRRLETNRGWAYVLYAISAPALVVAGANVRLRMLSSGHRFAVATAPHAPVAIVPGAKVGPAGQPMAYLRGRLDAAIELLAAGKVSEILISGDAAGTSGDEIACMRTYLLDRGVGPALIREDSLGLSTRATCERARDLFGIDRAIIVTQPRHAARAIALCRGAGIDADGVDAYCDCKRTTLVRNSIREWLAAPKAVAALATSPGKSARDSARSVTTTR